MLHRTVITKADTCITYAFKRTGTKTECSSAHDLDKYFDFVPYESSLIEVGDIVLWNQDRMELYSGMEILENGAIISHGVWVKIHVGVIESIEPKLVSDFTRNVMPHHVPTIRIRDLSETTTPNFILKRKLD